METTASMLIIFSSLLILLFQPSHSKTLLLDGVAEWRNPNVYVGDSIIFRHKHSNYTLYIFNNGRAFNFCNFTQATLLNKPNSTSFMWHPMQPGFFYFSFNDDSLKPCEEGEKLAIRVSPMPPENQAFSPEFQPLAAPAPSPTFGGVISSSPLYNWPFRSHQSRSRNSAPTESPPATVPATLPDTGGEMPFINSNPAVPLPTGEPDAATIRPLPISGHQEQMVGLLAIQMPLCCMAWLILQKVII